jgi:hypothetical protein
MLKNGTRVVCEFGSGTVVDNEFYSLMNGGTYRYGVKLDVQRFFYCPAYFWPKELKVATKEVPTSAPALAGLGLGIT